MFCENCGKGLIRGYQFCLECGTPVPPEVNEDEQPTAETPDGMPAIEPSPEEGTLVFCSTCGMRMQKTTAYCEKCGMQLQGGSAANNNIPKNGDVPLWNTNPIDSGFEGMSDNDIDQINNFMNGGGGIAVPEYDDSTNAFSAYEDTSGMDAIGGGIGGAAEIDALTAQFANIARSSNEMPAIGNSKDTIVYDEIRKVENFAMDSSYVDREYVDTGSLPVIEGASMEFDPDEPEPEDPNAFVMTPEPIEAITPTYEAPAAVEEAPVYEEHAYEEPAAVEEAPVYEEPAYEEPAAVEEAPVYEEPAYEEPAAVEEAPVYEEPAYEEPVAVEEAPVYEEPAYEEPVAVEEAPVYEEPAYEEPVAVEEAPVYEEPAYEEPVAVEEAPVYEEPAVDIPVYQDDDTSVEDIPAYTSDDEPAYAADIPVFEDTEEPANEPAPAEYTAAEDTYTDNVSDTVTEPEANSAYEPSYNDTYNNSSAYDDNSSASIASAISATASTVAAAAAEPEAEAEPEVDLGRLLYCRNCGQDMYEKELVCKNCGAPKREEYKPKMAKVQKEPFKLFGVLSIPAMVGIAAVVVVLGILLLTSGGINDGKSSLTGNEQLNANATTVSTTTTTPTESEPQDTTASSATTTSATETTPEEVTDTTEPVESVEAGPVETVEDSNASTPEDTSEPEVTSTSSTTVSTPSTSSSASSATSTTKPATTTSTTRPTTTTRPAAPSYAPSATVKAQDKERDKIVAAFAAISEEMGKVDLLARTTVATIAFDSRAEETAAKSFYTRDIATSMIKNIKSGKSAVASAVSAAKPTSSELKGAYNALTTLQSKYLDYYNYVVNPSTFKGYESKCDSYLNSFNSYAKNSCAIAGLNTSAQTATDKNEYYAYVLGEAIAAVENASAAYSTMRSKVAALKDSTFEAKFSEVLINNMSTYMKAAKYTQAARSYCNMLSSAPSAYSSAYSYLKTACAELESAADTFQLGSNANTLSSFKSSVNNDITAAQSAAAAAKKYL